ncbi:MAG: hypothetical protein C0392_08025 [Syntrophus sp. (in: bacteria)]|nr:hypothetical protein [Syntrophus sp. (in: bacteria)]
MIKIITCKEIGRLSMGQKTIFWFLSGLAIITFFLSVSLVYNHLSYKNRVVHSARERVINHSEKAAGEIDDVLKKNMSIVHAIANDLSKGTLARDSIPARLKAALEQNPHLHGIGVAYTPYAYSPARRLYAPYYSKKQGKPHLTQVESVYEYTRPEHEWFSMPLAQGPAWIEPYFGTAGATLMTTYSVPFFRNDPLTKKAVPIGVVALDISLGEIRRIVESIDYGPGGHGSVISKKGTYLYHLNDEFAKNQKTFVDVANDSNVKDLISIGNKSIKGEKGIADHASVTTGLPSWLVYLPIPSTGWSLHTSFIKKDIPVDIDILRQQLMQIAVISALFLLSCTSILLRVYEGDNGNLWKASAIVSVLFLVSIGLVWKIALSYDNDLKNKGTRIHNKASLKNFTNKYDKASFQKQTGQPVYIPTGIFINSIEFSGSNKMLVSGYIWQKYSDKFHKGITEGFVLPDGIDDTVIKEAYSQRVKDGKVMGWRFSGALYQHFDYSDYPVDHEVIRIRISTKEPGKNIVLIPDMDSYKLLNPGALPGLDKNFALPDWKIKSTFYEFISKNYDTNFGIQNYVGQEGLPELCFNVMIKRNLMDAFIRNMTPLIIVALLLFAIMFINTEEKMSKKFAMDIGEGLVFVGSMFFVLIFSHISTRGKIPTQEIFYLEYFYFAMYLALLWVPISSVLLVITKRMSFVAYKNNYISKLLYWPVILGALFVISVIQFY